LFHLNGKFCELNFSALNNIFGFPPSIDITHCHVAEEFNPNTFWNLITKGYEYDITYPKGTIISNAYIIVA